LKQSIRQRRPTVALAFGFLFASRCLLLALPPSPDITAKFLAGLIVPAAPVEGPSDDSAWVIHSRELDRAWQRTGQQQLPAIANWASSFLQPANPRSDTMFYMFSGPDFLYAHAFFPDARTYILSGTEPIGPIPDLATIPTDALPATLANLRKSLGSVLNWSFFITKDMQSDLTRTQLGGILPLLYVFLARTGYNLESVQLLALDRDGNVVWNPKSRTPGVRIVVTSPAGLSQTIFYFCTDLSDDGIKANPGFMRFCANQGRGVALLKAASYLMHETGFSGVRDFLLEHSNMIVQDDSGIPLRFFEGQNWSMQYCGRYIGPIAVFNKYWQADLADAYAHNGAAPLPFSFGYRWQPKQSDLIIAMRSQFDTTLSQQNAGSANQGRPLGR
jgi:hypothetical protein